LEANPEKKQKKHRFALFDMGNFCTMHSRAQMSDKNKSMFLLKGPLARKKKRADRSNLVPTYRSSLRSSLSLQPPIARATGNRGTITFLSSICAVTIRGPGARKRKAAVAKGSEGKT